MSNTVPDVGLRNGLASAVTAGFKKLLSEKHLYQSVDVDDSFVSKLSNLNFLIGQARFVSMSSNSVSSAEIKPQNLPVVRRVLHAVWIPVSTSSQLRTGGFSQSPEGIGFDLPTILTFCHHCKHRWPCNPFTTSEYPQIGLSSISEQWFFLSYQCQTCKKDAIRFLVRRSGMKLTLSGRDPIEILPAPKVLPKKAAKFFGDALIAHHAGQTLAGVFLLRVFIEQFWISVPEVAVIRHNGPRLSGDALGEAYKSTLPDDFKKRFPTLIETYSNLSAAMHTADASAEIFDKSSEEIVTHFEARRLFRLLHSEKDAHENSASGS